MTFKGQDIINSSAPIHAKWVWTGVSAGGLVTSFVMHAIPYLQFVALLLTIAAAVRAWRKGK